ncbi:MAG: winged helix-turn-helix domain-containing protein [Myxococcota bacterium]
MKKRTASGEPARELLCFDDYAFDLRAGELRYGSRAVPLEPKVARVLGFLLQNAGRVVPREELLASLWPNTPGRDAALNYAIRRVRQALADCASPVISTHRGSGYRVDVDVRASAHANDTLSAFELLERRSALQALWSQFESCARRRRSLLSLVTGMAGIGKSSLVQEFRRELLARGERALTLTGAESLSPLRSERGAQRRPEVIVIEDIHERDASSFHALCELSASHDQPARHYVVTCRTPVARRQADALGELARHARTLALEPLSEAAARKLLRTISAGTVSARFEPELLRLGAGNPLFLRELADCVRDGRVAASADLFATSFALRDALRRHFSGLPEPTQRLLERAALLGERFDARWLLHDSQHRLRDVLSLLEAAIGQQLVQPLTQLEFRFMHPLFPEYLRAQVPDLRRREWHWAIGTALESLLSGQDDPHLSNLAFHLSEGALGGEQAAKAAHFRQLAHVAPLAEW